ncbi:MULTISPECIES: protein Mom [unclassified Crossiella]|uniref:Mom family adenine methylcarbamoylation protein n=1 Tax=unclassified Crossiella TaxID=2620835 RepID=UPI001FFEDE2D|nr:MULTISPECIES: protein Mom [unclassified Crossiella]MCK2239388.1 protein Mom [Crossiella sp. S99.2]MCK2252083.1 protein Mom [Crossiella sp. S99.1]
MDSPQTDPTVPLLVAPCRTSAARHAVRHWHYSARMPAAGKNACFGVWEHGVFTGAILFGRGATNNIGSPYNLSQAQCVELTRIALREHEQPVTRMVAAALRQLRAACPGLLAVVSYADTEHGHHGGIYQAGNWIYTGMTSPYNSYYRLSGGRVVHGRTLRHMAVNRPPGEKAEDFVRRTIDPEVQHLKVASLKHRYVLPLTRTMRRRIAHLAKPYPKPDR